jgi:protein associated with RNAse G/E
MHRVTVIKNDHTGREVWRYQGRVLRREDSLVVLEARFDHDEVDVGPVTFRRGDSFVERFYSDRWYNIFEVHDANDGHLKGWYCNIARPAALLPDEIRADDLGLDVFVHPDGRTLTLDQDEFDALPLDEGERRAALDGLAELRRLIQERCPPFDALPS